MLMGAADEILKAKNLLDVGAITQEEFEEIKKKILNTGEKSSATTQNQPVRNQVESKETKISNSDSAYSYSTPSTHSDARPTTSSTSSYRFIPKYFYIVGYSLFAVSILFDVVVMVLLSSNNAFTATMLTWEFTVVPAAVAMVLGIIVKNKANENHLMVAGIVAFLCAISLSVAAGVMYYQEIYKEIHNAYSGSHYYYSIWNK